MSKLSMLGNLKEALDMNPMDLLGRQECVGCEKTTGLEKCEGTMCFKCWEQENIEYDPS